MKLLENGEGRVRPKKEKIADSEMAAQSGPQWQASKEILILISDIGWEPERVL